MLMSGLTLGHKRKLMTENTAEKPMDASKALSVDALAAKKDAEREAMYLAASGKKVQWQVKFDEEKGEKYWENTDTGEVTYTEPPEEETKTASELENERRKKELENLKRMEVFELVPESAARGKKLLRPRSAHRQLFVSEPGAGAAMKRAMQRGVSRGVRASRGRLPAL